MFDGFFKVLNVEPAEQKATSLLLGMGFFMGIFVASLNVGAFSLFFGVFSEKEIPYSFIASGLVGIVVSYLFSFLQKRLPYQQVVFILVFLFFIILTVGLIGLNIPSVRNYSIFLLYAFSDPMGIVMLLMFWGSFNRIFNLRQSKRIIGGIDTGQLIAAILAYFSIPQIEKILAKTEYLLFLSFGSIVIFLIFFLMAGKSFSMNINTNESGIEKKDSVKIGAFFKNRFILLMSLFVIISAISLQFLDYTFLTVADRQFLSESDLAAFKSYFEMVIVIFSFLFQTFTTDKIISIYGLKVALLINPVLLMIFTGIALGVGVFTGIDAGSEYFVYFFVVIAMIRLFISSLRDALDGPSFKLYFLPLDSSIRLDVQSKIEGVVTVLSGIISGGAILLIERFPIFSIWHILLFMLPLIGFWYLITIKMYNRYKGALIQMLEKNRLPVKKAVNEKDKSIEKYLNDNLPGKAIQLMASGGSMDHALLEDAFHQLDDQTNTQFYQNLDVGYWESIYNKIDSPKTRAEKEVGEVRKLALSQIKNLKESDKPDIPASKLYMLAKSRLTHDRLFVLQILKRSIGDENAFIVQELLRDLRPEVRFEAIRISQDMGRMDIWPSLVELLATPRYSYEAMTAIVKIGEPIIPFLATYFNQTSVKEDLMIRIITCIIRIGGAQSSNVLWTNIEFPVKRVQQLVIDGLYELNFKTNDDQRLKVESFLKEEVGKALWNIMALTEVPNKGHFEFLKIAIQQDLEANKENVYRMMSLIYDKESVNLVRENIETGTNESITFAIELMDIFLHNDIKLFLFPYFDDVSVEDKIKSLHVFYPREKLSPDQLILYVLNRDIHLSGTYTKAAALHAWLSGDFSGMRNEIVAQVFNSDPLLYELAASCVLKEGLQMYRQVEDRLNDKVRHRIHTLLLEKDNRFSMRFEIFKFLEKMDFFRELKKETLVEIVSQVIAKRIRKGSVINIDDYIVVVVSGSVNSEKDITFTTGEMIIDFESKLATVEEESILYLIDKEKFYYLVGVNTEIAEQFMQLMNTHKLLVTNS